MPKKFAPENPKAAAARERKKAAKDAEQVKKQQQQDEAFWRDDDKSMKKKQQKRDDIERKKEQQLAKKAETKMLLEQEMDAIKPTRSMATTSKTTRAQISAQLAKKEVVEKTDKKLVTHLDMPLEENVNRLSTEGEEARSVLEAIQILSDKPDEGDKHPEKRIKAAFATYEARRLEEMKIENPTLRLSQLKQIIFKEWQKSPENPMNQQ